VYSSRQSQSSSDGHPRALLWGFKCESRQERESGEDDEKENDGDDECVRRWFKTLLEPAMLEKMEADALGTHEDVKRWITDFLHFVYEELVNISKTLRSWHQINGLLQR